MDDAFILPALERVAPEEQETITKLLQDPEVKSHVEELGLNPDTKPNSILEALTDPNKSLGAIFPQISGVSSDLARMIEERHSLRRLVALIEEEVSSSVVQCSPEDDLPDLTKCDLVLIDYYLEGSRGTGDRAKEIARQVRQQQDETVNQQVVLMSTFEKVREDRAEFRAEAGLSGVAFAFVAKSDMDERWKVKAQLEMLARARPHAPVLAAYRSRLEGSLRQATETLLRLADNLDIGDYAYLQSQALMDDGHPLGDYVSWLLSCQLTTLAFETEEMRSIQLTVDKLEFDKKPFAPTEPSLIVAQLYHSALLSSNLGPLGPHPRAKPEGAYGSFPLVQLGDVFLDKECSKAAVVLSAACDLAFTPTDTRPPNAETPVILVLGEPSVLIEGLSSGGSATEGIVHGDQVYRIDWDFGGYRCVRLGDLSEWLTQEGFDTTERDRLRPLYSLKLQQEFGAHILRVGPPVMPPLTYATEGKLFMIIGESKELLTEFTSGEVMLSHYKGSTELRMTPKIVHEMKLSAEELHSRLDENDVDRRKMDAMVRNINDNDYWIGLLDGVKLNKPGAILDKGSICSFVRGSDWENLRGPRIVLEISEKGTVGT